jgi:hypothetical protein
VTLPAHIKTPGDIARVFIHLYEVESLSFHPDESFDSYGRYEGGERFGSPRKWIAAYTAAEAKRRDSLMRQAFKVAEKHGLDIYCLGMWAGAFTGYGAPPETCEGEKEKKYFFPPGVFEWWPEE